MLMRLSDIIFQVLHEQPIQWEQGAVLQFAINRDFTRLCVPRPRWKSGPPITFGGSKNCLRAAEASQNERPLGIRGSGMIEQFVARNLLRRDKP
jgi:hypothetical protein